MKTVLVLGGYGNFGKRIVQGLTDIEGLTIIVAGRSLHKAQALIASLTANLTANLTINLTVNLMTGLDQGASLPKQAYQPLPFHKSVRAQLNALGIDIFSDDFAQTLTKLAPTLVIHTSGPFQGQQHHVAQACLQAGAHYIDLADDRHFVCNITKLDKQARDSKLLLVSGASSVPGLSSAVVDYYQDQFRSIDSIDLAIAPGNKAERGEATISAILSYTGHAFSVFDQGQWQQVFGWMNPRRLDFGDSIGKRWLANVDVPDLALFTQRYRVKLRVRFQAGLELPGLHFTLFAMAYLSKKKIVKSWAPLAKFITAASNLFNAFGSDDGAMQVEICGRDQQNQAKTIKWTLIARHGVGPYIPTLSTIILARKLLVDQVTDSALNQLTRAGALPGLGLLSLPDFYPYFEQLGIDYQQQISGEC